MKNSRYVFQPSEKGDGYVVTDTEYGLVCRFQHGRFNSTQKFTFLEDVNLTPSVLARVMRELGDWMAKNHYQEAMEKEEI